MPPLIPERLAISTQWPSGARGKQLGSTAPLVHQAAVFPAGEVQRAVLLIHPQLSWGEPGRNQPFPTPLGRNGAGNPSKGGVAFNPVHSEWKPRELKHQIAPATTSAKDNRISSLPPSSLQHPAKHLGFTQWLASTS